jgi:two-component system NtrC family sensor kinase
VRRRRTVSRKPAKTRHGKATKPKRRNAPTAARRGSSSAAGLQEQVTFLARELAEAREQQAATADVLNVIGRSPADIQSVFDTIVENVVQLLGGAVSGFVYRFDGDLIHLVAHDRRVTPEALQVFNAVYPLKPSRTSVIAQAIRRLIE